VGAGFCKFDSPCRVLGGAEGNAGRKKHDAVERCGTQEELDRLLPSVVFTLGVDPKRAAEPSEQTAEEQPDSGSDTSETGSVRRHAYDRETGRIPDFRPAYVNAPCDE